jgi:hypothetical protein
VVNNTWDLYPSGTNEFGFINSIVFQNKFYFFHDENPVIFDPETILWSNWTQVPNFSRYSCTVVYKNTLLRFGGGTYGFYRAIYQYDFKNDSWVQLNSSNAPMDLVESSCGVLPNDNIMMMGSTYNGNYHYLVSVYNVTSNNWTFYGSHPEASYGSHIFSFGQQTFTVFDKYVFEFDYNNITFTLQPFSFKKYRSGAFSSVYVPSGMLNSLPNGCRGS